MLAYDSRDNVVRITGPRVIRYVYDELSRLMQILPPGGTTTFTYDARGNPLTAGDGDSSLSFTYDALNRVTEAATQDLGHQPSVTLTYDYDAVGNRRRLDDSVGGSNRYTFDEASRLTGLITPAGDVIGLTYDAGGRPSGVRFPNGVVSKYRYDAPGHLAAISHTGPRDNLLAGFDYTYNGVGHLLSSTEPTGTAEITYDTLRRVTRAGTTDTLETYAYDAVGNRTASSLSSTHRYDDANRLLEDDDFTYTYDAYGNLATKTANVDGSVTRFAFGAVNRLQRIDLPDGTVASYRYDAFGRRIEKSVGGVTTRYVYDGFNILLEFDGANSLTSRYSHGNRIDEALSMERGGASYFYHTDRLGSTRIITDGGGSVINSYTYDAYGRVTSSTEGVANPFTYTGRERDAESGFYNYRARYYDPWTGRFISEDPIGLLGGDPNLFGYVRGNPVNFVDPFGIFDWQAPSGRGIAGATGFIGGSVARGWAVMSGSRFLAGRIAVVAGGTVAAHVGLLVSIATIVEAIGEAGRAGSAWWGADRAEYQAALAEARLKLFRTGRDLSPCNPDYPRLKRTIEEYDKVLGDAITGRRSITDEDLKTVKELVGGEASWTPSFSPR